MKGTLLLRTREFTSGSGRKDAHTSSALRLKIVDGKNQWCLLHTHTHTQSVPIEHSLYFISVSPKKDFSGNY